MEVMKATESQSLGPFSVTKRAMQGTFEVVKRIPASRFLTSFTADKKRKGKAGEKVKFEYMRIRLYRSLKRTLRLYYKNKSLALGGVASRPKSGSLTRFTELEEEIKGLCKAEEAALAPFSEKMNGPNIDHSSEKRERWFNTYNNKYVEFILSQAPLRRLYTLYLELIFEERDITRRCENWKMRCCEGSQHTPQCEQKWDEFKYILMQETEIYINNEYVFRPMENTEDV